MFRFSLVVLSCSIISACTDISVHNEGVIATISSLDGPETCWDVRAYPSTAHVHATVTRLDTALGQTSIVYYKNNTDNTVLAAYSGRSCAYYVSDGTFSAPPFAMDPRWCSYTTITDTLHISLEWNNRRLVQEKRDTFEIKVHATNMRLFNIKELL
jgi:hypothetical protein